MIFPDYHLHTSFSSDAVFPIEDMINSAKQKGINSICVTDHYDIDFPIQPNDPDMDFYLPVDKYYEYMSKTKASLAPDFDLKIGIELGVMPYIGKKLRAFTPAHPELDFIISSVHLVDDLDPYYPEYFQEKTTEQAYRRYFETILECLKEFSDFNVLGHIDYVVRYGNNTDYKYNPKDYQDIFEEIFKIIVPKGIGIEINTGSLYKNLSFPHPHMDILNLYKKAGGEIITIGSDAHTPEYIGYGFDIAKQILTNCGFKYYSTFSCQKPEFHSIA